MREDAETTKILKAVFVKAGRQESPENEDLIQALTYENGVIQLDGISLVDLLSEIEGEQCSASMLKRRERAMRAAVLLAIELQEWLGQSYLKNKTSASATAHLRKAFQTYVKGMDELAVCGLCLRSVSECKANPQTCKFKRQSEPEERLGAKG